jgi:hypothetical protein
MDEKNWGKNYTEFWTVKKDQTGAQPGQALVSSKHGLNDTSFPIDGGNAKLKAISPISCREGFVLAEDTEVENNGDQKYKEYEVLKKASIFHKMGFSNYGGSSRKKKRSASSSRKPVRRNPVRKLRVKRSRSGSKGPSRSRK